MVIAKQMEIRSNIKEYFDLAFQGETIIVPRKQKKNVVIISEAEYNELKHMQRMKTYSRKVTSTMRDQVAGAGNLKETNFQKLSHIDSLSDNWNGNGAPAIPSEVIKKTQILLESLPIQPEIFPTALSSIQLEFDNSGHDHMEIDVSEADTFDIFIITYMGTESEETIPADFDLLSERVMQFYG